MNDRIHRFEHGGVVGASIQVLEPEQWDLNRMLPESLHLPIADSTITYTYACATLNVKGKHILIDAGYNAKETVDALAELSISQSDIETVLITHGDGDHVAGLLTDEGDLSFPNALYVMHQQLWQYWLHVEEATVSEAQKELAHRLLSLLEGRITLLSETRELEAGIRFFPSLGHRHGHAIYQFETTTTPILHSGDTLFHPVYIDHPKWPDTLALDPEQEILSRGLLLERAAVSGALVLTGHMPFPGMGYIQKTGNGYRWQTAHTRRRRTL